MDNFPGRGTRQAVKFQNFVQRIDATRFAGIEREVERTITIANRSQPDTRSQSAISLSPTISTKSCPQKGDKTEEEYLNTTLALGNNKTNYINITKDNFDNKNTPLVLKYNLNIDSYAKSVANKTFINLDIDRTLWFLACEILFVDDDSYVHKGKMDYYLYRDLETGRMTPLEFDGNSCMMLEDADGWFGWTPFYNANDPNYPLLNRLLNIPSLRQRYLAHVRTLLLELLDPGFASIMIDNYAAMIDEEVQNDDKKIYSYDKALYGSFKNYKTTLKHLRSYIKETYSKKDVLLSKVDYHFISHFSLYILKETECNNNGMMKHMQRLKKVINFSLKNNYVTNNPFTGFKISFKRTNRVYLTKEELLTISQVTLNETLSKVRDVFLFSCYTGLSYVDLYNLKKENIKSGNDGLEWVYINRSKTNIPSNLPLLPPAFSLLKKYREIEKKNRENKENAREKIERNRENRVFPMISNQKINKALKEISLLCNFNKKLTFHSARHTFATTVTLTNGVPIETVSKMLGHNNIRTTQIYARVIDSKISSDMLKLREKFI